MRCPSTGTGVRGTRVTADKLKMLDAAIASAEKRKAFAGRVHKFLILSDVKLISSELGRDASRAIWILTVLLPNQRILTLHAPVRSPYDPYAPQTVMSVVFRALRYLRAHQLVKEQPSLCE